MENKIDCIQSCLHIGELIDTLSEAVQLLHKAFDQNLFLLDDIPLCLQSITANLPATEKQQKTRYKSRLISLSKNISDKNKQAIVGSFQDYSAVVIDIICPALVQTLSADLAVEAALCERLFLFCQNPCLKNSNSRSMLQLMTALKARTSLPLLSYQNVMQAFMTTPDLYKNTNITNRTPYVPAKETYRECCPICGGAGQPYHCAVQYLAQNYEAMFAPAKLWQKCESCGNLYAYNFPILAQDDFVTGLNVGDTDNDLIEPRPLSVFAKVLRDIQPFCKGTRLLEVGVGNGELMAMALEMNYEVEAVEIAIREAQKIARVLEHPIHCCDFLQFESDHQFDVITMGDVIEHMSAPVEAIKKAYDLLTDEGVLWLSTPNYRSAFSLYKKQNDPMWNEPWHTCYFSYRTILPILEQIGFEVKIYDASQRYNGCMELVLTKKSTG